MVLMGLEMITEYSKYPRDALMKLSSRSNIGKLVKTIPFLQVFFLDSWRTGMFLMKLEQVYGYSIYSREALLKVSSRSNIRKLVKISPIIKVSFWSLGGHRCS